MSMIISWSFSGFHWNRLLPFPLDYSDYVYTQIAKMKSFVKEIQTYTFQYHIAECQVSHEASLFDQMRLKSVEPIHIYNQENLSHQFHHKHSCILTLYQFSYFQPLHPFQTLSKSNKIIYIKRKQEEKTPQEYSPSPTHLVSLPVVTFNP